MSGGGACLLCCRPAARSAALFPGPFTLHLPAPLPVWQVAAGQLDGCPAPCPSPAAAEPVSYTCPTLCHHLLRSSRLGGFDFMPSPSEQYYRELPKKMGNLLTPQQARRDRTGCDAWDCLELVGAGSARSSCSRRSRPVTLVGVPRRPLAAAGTCSCAGETCSAERPAKPGTLAALSCCALRPLSAPLFPSAPPHRACSLPPSGAAVQGGAGAGAAGGQGRPGAGPAHGMCG